MAIRSSVPREVGTLRNKISVNTSDEEMAAIERVGFRENASNAGVIRILMLKGLYVSGERVTAHEFMDLEGVPVSADSPQRERKSSRGGTSRTYTSKVYWPVKPVEAE